MAGVKNVVFLLITLMLMTLLTHVCIADTSSGQLLINNNNNKIIDNNRERERERERKPRNERCSVLVQRFNAVLLHDSLPDRH